MNAPVKQRKLFFYFLSLANLLRTDRKIQLLRDFNFVCHNEDHSVHRGRYDYSDAVLTALICEYNLVDGVRPKSDVLHISCIPSSFQMLG